jgi:hypothetical protein
VVRLADSDTADALLVFDPLRPFFLLIVISLVTYRVTRLIAADAFPLIAVPREWIINKLGEDHWFSYLITCMWCASMYVAAGTVALFDRYTSVPWPYAMVFAASAITGTIATHEPEVD